MVASEGESVRQSAIVEPITDADTKVDQMEAVAQAASPPDKILGHGAISADERAAIITVQMADGMTDVTPEVKDDLTNVADDLSGALPAGTQSAIGGELFSNEFPGISISELLGVAIALDVLIVTLGSLG